MTVRCFHPLHRALLLAAVALSAPRDAARAAGPVVSAVTTTCRAPAGRSDTPPARMCSGPVGWVVRRAEADLRETVSAGRDRQQAEAEPAASQSFGPFNSSDAQIEWRLAPDGQPFAMIQRWHLADNEDTDNNGRPRTRPLLVVTRLAPGAVCHVAYIDVAANADAEALARQAAHDLARGFDCTKDKVTAIGATGRATALALPR